MLVIKSVPELKQLLKPFRLAGKSIGFVPTMGYLHQGHLSLMRQAKADNDVAVASIFVNPLQFGANEDYSVYPRDLERDSSLAADAGIDVLFTPGVEDMYPNGFTNMLTFVDVRKVTERLCGAFRPGHFRGVATVVSKLFHIVEPQVAYFGQKDAQQVVVIKQMVADLNMNVKIVTMPIVRETDGLAMSSRNVYLTPEERQAALSLSRSLKLAETMLRDGCTDAGKIAHAIRAVIEKEPLAVIDYISVSHANTIEEQERIEAPTLIALAVRFGKTRLIDNMIWEGK
ncbi:Pantothenate synthetase [Sporomusa carbonis]|uniref:pantoate--beta-alanine ligase n=1 Tax=Sporomusa carbonis TaxID=3076075 RepID=UPI003A7A8F2C